MLCGKCKDCKAKNTYSLLSDLPIGSSALILDNSKLKRRLVDMGLTPGTKITLTRCAPLGDPIEISLRGYSFALRKDEAKNIQIIPNCSQINNYKI
ncbi:MAG: ferrous iron transport protein A [Oscillospiraceae bacterium]